MAICCQGVKCLPATHSAILCDYDLESRADPRFLRIQPPLPKGKVGTIFSRPLFILLTGSTIATKVEVLSANNMLDMKQILPSSVKSLRI